MPPWLPGLCGCNSSSTALLLLSVETAAVVCVAGELLVDAGIVDGVDAVCDDCVPQPATIVMRVPAENMTPESRYALNLIMRLLEATIAAMRRGISVTVKFAHTAGGAFAREQRSYLADGFLSGWPSKREDACRKTEWPQPRCITT